MSKNELNYFSEDERLKQKKFAQKRTQFLIPLLSILDKYNIRPDHISYFALILLIPFIVFFKASPVLSSICLVSYTLLDGIDGSLARYQKSENKGGSFTDIVIDQLGILLLVGAIIYFGDVNNTIAYIYGIFYIIMISFAIVQTSNDIPLQPIIRSKYIIYFIYIFLSIPLFKTTIENHTTIKDIYTYSLGIFSAGMLVTNTISYLRIKKYFTPQK